MNRENATVYAHTHPDHPTDRSKWQPLEAHLSEVANKAAKFAESFGSTDWAWNAGWLHDIGKTADEFQAYLLRENGLDDSEYDGVDSGRVNHSSAGAALAEELFSRPNLPLGRPLAYLAAGHHAGLPDYYETDTGRAALRIRMEEGHRNLRCIREKVKNPVQNLRSVYRLPPYVKKEQFHLWVRMLFSCLTDADSLDTETFMQPEKAGQRTPFPSLVELKDQLDNHLSDLADRSEQTPVNQARRDVLAACRAAAKKSPGMFSLSVPTGGGKTLSSMSFALDHAVLHGKRRVIYVIPYTSIVEQTANVFAGVFGSGNVVEHHSNLDPEKETSRSRLATDNWDAPIVITTNVQFFESLYSARPGRCRKLHNIVNSVIILDEAQLLPPGLLTPCVDVITQLVRHYGVTVVLATATQPALPGIQNVTEIVPNPAALYARLKRTQYSFPVPGSEPTMWGTLAARLASHGQVLCVVNSRKDCHDLFRLMPEGTIHLSALMCGEHRSEVIAAVKQRLNDGLSTRVVSTQLVEAGVDIDFPVVYRAWAGLDSIAQAAGRCNREGRLNEEGRFGEVHVFVPPKPSHPGLLRKGEDTTRELLQVEGFDPEQPAAFAQYFGLFYSRVNDMGASIMDQLVSNAPDVHFRTFGERFRFIDDTVQRPVIVRYGKSPGLIDQLRFAGPTREIMRSLQRYTVNLPRRMVDLMLADGRLEVVDARKAPDIVAQCSLSLYDDQVGLDVYREHLPVEDLVV